MLEVTDVKMMTNTQDYYDIKLINVHKKLLSTDTCRQSHKIFLRS
jgi:hypothetical protein